MNLKTINRDELKDILVALEEAFNACNIDYYLIGALARDVWFARGDKKFRTTKDIDFAVLVGSYQQYEEVRAYLTTNMGYVSSSTNTFVMIAPDKTPIDLLPFGALAIDDGVALHSESLTNIRVNGFMEVYEAGTAKVEVIKDHQFAVATLPAIVLLKLIAYDDRPEQRIKDARDIANIITQFFHMEGNMIFDHHSDLFVKEEDPDLDSITAIVTGREMYKILKGNSALYHRMIKILNGHIEKGENSEFIRNMALEAEATIDKMIKCLEGILAGLLDNRAA